MFLLLPERAMLIRISVIVPSALAASIYEVAEISDRLDGQDAIKLSFLCQQWIN